MCGNYMSDNKVVGHVCGSAVIANHLGVLVIYACQSCTYVKHFQQDDEGEVIHHKVVEKGQTDVAHLGSAMAGFEVVDSSAYQIGDDNDPHLDSFKDVLGEKND
jgi:hypothetical protein